MAGEVPVLLRKFRQRLPLLLLIRCPAPARLRFTFPVPVTFTRFANPLCVFCFDIVFQLLPIFVNQS